MTLWPASCPDERMRPPRALLLLLAIGLLDLLATAFLAARGSIDERNPLMAPVLDRGVLAFVTLKLATLILAAILLMRQDRPTVRHACLWGSAAYLGLLLAAFFG